MLSNISTDVHSAITIATHHSHSEKVFPDVEIQPPVFQFFSYCPWFYGWVPLKSLALSPLDPLSTYLHLIVLFSVLKVTAFSYRRDAAVSLLSLWPFVGLFSICVPRSFWGAQNWIEDSKSGLTSSGKREGSPSRNSWQYFVECTQDTIGLLFSKGTMMPPVQSDILSIRQSFSYKAAFHLCGS